MSRLFLFTPAPTTGGTTVTSQSKDAASSGSGPAGASAPFVLNPQDWHNLSQTVAAVLAARNQANGLLSSDPCASSTLQNAWRRLDAGAQGWQGDVMPSLKALAGDIVSYARDVVPGDYGRLEAILHAAGVAPLTPADGVICQQLLQNLRDEAGTRATRAATVAARIGPFADALAAFRDAYNALPRNPPVRVAMPDVPTVCLSYGGDSLACAGLKSSSDPKHMWQVEYLPPQPFVSGLFKLICAADPGKGLMVDPSPWGDNPMLEMMTKEAPRPRVAPCDVPGGETLFLLDGAFIRALAYKNHVFDCAGDSGWGEGTPVLNYRRNDGPNQHWRFEPRPRPWREVAFHDQVATAASFAQNVAGIDHLRGDWLAIADDLTAGIAAVLKSVQMKVPFIGALQVRQAIDG